MIELVKDMTPRLLGKTWRKYPTKKSNQKATYGLFECQYCGKQFECATNNINSGHTKSCGCQSTYNNLYGLSKSRFYEIWKAMRDRCNNPKHKVYKNYGGRGITVCEEWLDIANFVAWAEATHPNIEGVSLDRIDNDKGYSPDNCRWATREIQNTNQRMRKTNTSGFVGVSWIKHQNKWEAYITVNCIKVHLGVFKTPEEAAKIRDKYIVKNGLHHRLSAEFIKENK